MAGQNVCDEEVNEKVRLKYINVHCLRIFFVNKKNCSSMIVEVGRRSFGCDKQCTLRPPEICLQRSSCDKLGQCCNAIYCACSDIIRFSDIGLSSCSRLDGSQLMLELSSPRIHMYRRSTLAVFSRLGGRSRCLLLCSRSSLSSTDSTVLSCACFPLEECFLFLARANLTTQSLVTVFIIQCKPCNQVLNRIYKVNINTCADDGMPAAGLLYHMSGRRGYLLPTIDQKRATSSKTSRLFLVKLWLEKSCSQYYLFGFRTTIDSSQSRPALVVPGFSLHSGARLVTDRLFPHRTPAVYKAISVTHFTVTSFA